MGFFSKLFNRNWQYYRDKGNRYFDDGEPGLALHEYREALKKFNGNDDEKKEIESKISEVHRQLMRFQIQRAEQFQRAANFERARDALESALSHAQSEEEQEEIELRLEKVEMGVMEIERMKEEMSKRILEADADISIQPDDERFFILLGSLEQEQIDLYDSFGEAFRRGFLALHDGKLNEALLQLKKAREKNADHPFILIEQGRALLGLGQVKDAVAIMGKAYDKLPDNTYVQLRFVEALWESAAYDRAEEILDKAIQAKPDDEDVLMAVAQHAVHAQEFDKGIKAVKKLLDRKPTDYSLHRLLGQMFQGQGRLDKALDEYETTLKLKWEIDKDSGKLIFDATAAFQAAMIYIDEGKRLNRAIDLLHAMISVTEGVDRVGIYLLMAKAYEKKKQLRKAKETLETALRTVPKGATEVRGEVLRRMENLGKSQ